MSTRYAVVYRSGEYSSVTSTHRFRWAADNNAKAMNKVSGNSQDKLFAADELGIPLPTAYYEVREYDA